MPEQGDSSGLNGRPKPERGMPQHPPRGRPFSPASPDEPEAAPSATLLPEGAVPELPTDRPESVPWPPEITAESDTR